MFTKTKFKQLWCVYIIGIKNYFNSWLNVMQGIALQLVILLVWLTFKSNDPFILIALIGGSILRNSLYSFHRTLISERRNRWVDRLSNMPLNLSIRIIAQTLVSLTITFIVASMLLLLGFFGFVEQQNYIENINWLMVLSGLFLLVILSNLTAYVLNEWSNTSEWSQVVSVLFFNICWNFLGCAFPYYVIAEYDVLNTILYLVPHRYMFNVIQAGWVNATDMVYDNNSGYSVDFKMGGMLWVPYVMTFIYISIFLGLIFGHRYIKGIATFRTKEGAVYSKRIESEYIYKVRNSNSFDELAKLYDEHTREKTSTKPFTNISKQTVQKTDKTKNRD
ncbi:hypothetical protein [Spiroplasma endosymbiont of Othius punctulatus]|uniref:hypothetical protein n=1 Tax=Spiroplasma endosymbiont of Othius punctulatus TaxID=3066289 RepID=UPI0030CAE672